MSESGKVTIQDIAQRAGVGVGTVSRVLNNSDSVRPVTRARVQSVIDALGYRPNATARNLRASRTKTIGFISDLIASTPHAGRIVQGAQDLAWEHGCLLLVVNTGSNRAVLEAAVDMMLERQVDAMLYATMYHRPVSPPSVIREVPTVLLDCYVEDRSLPSVVPNEVNGGYMATKRLLDAGHRRIGFINNSHDVPAARGRLAGYQQAIKEVGITFDAELVATTEAFSRNGYESTHQLMTLSDPPTGIFCFNDQTTIGVYRALRERELSIPNDVGVVGFDNQLLIAPELDPPLTTLELPHYEMGRWAVDHLLHLLAGQVDLEQTPTQHMIDCPFIERASV